MARTTVKITEQQYLDLAKYVADGRRLAKTCYGSTLTDLAQGEPVDVSDTLDALINAMESEVSRHGQSMQRRQGADKVRRLWHHVRYLGELAEGTATPIPPVKTAIAAEHRFALSLLTPEQRRRVDDFAIGFREGAGS